MTHNIFIHLTLSPSVLFIVFEAIINVAMILEVVTRLLALGRVNKQVQLMDDTHRLFTKYLEILEVSVERGRYCVGSNMCSNIDRADNRLLCGRKE